MTISHQVKEEGIRVISLNDTRLDIVNAKELRDYVRSLVSKSSAMIVVDLSEVEYLDSIGIGALFACQEEAKSICPFRVMDAQKDVLNLLKVTRADKAFKLISTLAELGEPVT